MAELNKDFQCNICWKYLSRKQRLVTHQLSKHGISPNYEVQQYKRYKEDPSIPIPRSTEHYRKSVNQLTIDTKETSEHNKCQNSQDQENLLLNDEVTPGHGANNFCDANHLQNFRCDSYQAVVISNETACDSRYDTLEVDKMRMDIQKNTDNDSNNLSIDDMTRQSDTNSDCDNLGRDYTAVQGTLSDTDSDFDNGSIDDMEMQGTLSDSSNSSPDQTDSDSDCENLDVDTHLDSSLAGNFEDLNTCSTTVNASFSKSDEQIMTLIAFMMKYHYGRQESIDLVRMMKLINPNLELKDIQQQKHLIGSFEPEIVHFCESCFTIFPKDENITNCQQPGCFGLRYRGSANQQHRKLKKSYFTTISVCQQLKDVLQRADIWTTINRYRELCAASENITDILNAEMYKELCKPGNFLASGNNLTLLFNTDGVPLYKSSGVSLWPVYLVINELPPVLRFSRQNMILWGVWQSHGKPVFHTFLQPFIEHMKFLKNEGITLSIQLSGGVAKQIVSKVMLLAGTMDLQAKAYLAAMTQHNGCFGCITCEDPGEVVKQGRGHTRIYPYRQQPDIPKQRITSEVLQWGVNAIQTGKPQFGIKGVSCLHGLEWFDFLSGLVPDYMHGILLGVAKMLLKLWFSSSNSGKPCYLGKCLKGIDHRLNRMQPTDEISRLPRRIESHLHHLKASELQNWLLFYSIPCLIDFMEKEYLDHLALLVEGIYILLGDQISEAKLLRAEHVLNQFYFQFAGLYGKSNSTLNLHNAGKHLVHYVKKLGPLWAWSCFSFEDMNGTILQSVHGTGDVCLQILGMMQVKKSLLSNVVKMKESGLKEFVKDMTNTHRRVKIKREALNCQIAGGMKLVKLEETLASLVRKSLRIPADVNLGDISMVKRVIIQDKVYFSRSYTRMTKRIAYIVLCNEESNCPTLASIQHFLYHHGTNKCVAVIKPISIKENCAWIHPTVAHLVSIESPTADIEDRVIALEVIKEKVLYIGGNTMRPCISRLPNLYGQCS